MTKHYLTSLLLTLSVMVIATLCWTTSVDPFGIYGNDSDAALSRIDQFYHTRSTKPLIVQQKMPSNLIVGSSRTARLSPSSAKQNTFYNAAIPGATPAEIRQILEYAHFNHPLDSAIIGWDFEAFLPLLPEFRSGFNNDLMDAHNLFSLALYSAIAHKRTAFSFIAMMESYKANTAIDNPNKPTYRADGSWHRNQPNNIGPFAFNIISKEKLELFAHDEPLPLQVKEIERTIRFCHDNNIQCQILATPVHLFHFEIFRKTGLMAQWKQWHRRLVSINARVAQVVGREPFPVWAFNAFSPAVNEPIRVAKELETPWFTDNLHFRPRFGDVMLNDMTSPSTEPSAGLLLTPDNVEAYLDGTLALQRDYLNSDKRAVNSIKRNLKF
ncbi:MAG: hypothetical protein ACI9JM_000863 [Halioglobus sp.]|jgi:hypothetical protein